MTRPLLLRKPTRSELRPQQLRRVLDALYDGEPLAFPTLLAINNQYKRAHYIFMWLLRQKITGMKVVEFFQNESGDSDGKGLLSGVTFILNKIDGEPHRKGRLKITELL